MNALAAKPSWDIFCKIVDNFGDIGVCWRLARQLHIEHDLQIRLWVNDLGAAQKIIPNLFIDINHQICDEISIIQWDDTADFSQAAYVVIEAFACGLPPAYLAAMTQQRSKWINLEYLTAEPWVGDFHAKPSPQANGLTRYFYFPGFTEKTGGLIRECNIIELNQKYITNHNTLKVSLFCYPNAPIHDLLTALQSNDHEVLVYVTASSILPQIASFLGQYSIGAGDYFTHNNLHVRFLPFLSQADYDALLRDCDINFVRGEDSWVRAIWAGRPFIWQPYFQTEDTHIKKLDAFLDTFYADFEAKQVVCEAHSAWVVGQLSNEIWQSYLHCLTTINTYTRQQSNQLAKLDDLAAKLVIFCNKIQ